MPQKAAQWHEQYVCVVLSFALLHCCKDTHISAMRYVRRRTPFWYTAVTALYLNHAEISLCTPDMQLLSYHSGRASDVPHPGREIR